jgi:hypothetical protein
MNYKLFLEGRKKNSHVIHISAQKRKGGVFSACLSNQTAFPQAKQRKGEKKKRRK